VCEVGIEFFCVTYMKVYLQRFFLGVEGGGGISCFLLSNLFPEVVWF